MTVSERLRSRSVSVPSYKSCIVLGPSAHCSSTTFFLFLILVLTSIPSKAVSFSLITTTTTTTGNSNELTPTGTGIMASVTSTVGRNAIGKLRPDRTVLLLCDVQERFRPLIYNMETVINTCRYMTSVAKILDIPVVATQQYTQVFGSTISECFATSEEMASTPIYEKKLFSMCTDEVLKKLSEFNRDSYLVVGIEAHVCVQQTCLDLLETGNHVHVIVDGVSSQQPLDRVIALERLRHAGAFLTTAQSAAFMLAKSADNPNFKPFSKLTVEHMKLPNEFNEALKK
eukprot:Pompholyxophrys_punicea_v1_NODE_162_length_3055_cov_4.636000.p2 type:complete len:286 gc:universal NODE_162_length_3055_cov_4.636000:687-1544(+)